MSLSREEVIASIQELRAYMHPKVAELESLAFEVRNLDGAITAHVAAQKLSAAHSALKDVRSLLLGAQVCLNQPEEEEDYQGEVRPLLIIKDFSFQSPVSGLGIFYY